MIDVVFGSAVLKVEVFSNLLWKNVRKLNLFDTCHLRIWRDLEERDDSVDFTNALNEFVNLNGISAIETDSVGDNSWAGRVLEFLHEKLRNLLVAASNKKLHTNERFGQQLNSTPKIAQVKNKVVQKCTIFRENFEILTRQFEGVEALNRISPLYLEVVHDLFVICSQSYDETTTHSWDDTVNFDESIEEKEENIIGKEDNEVDISGYDGDLNEGTPLQPNGNSDGNLEKTEDLLNQEANIDHLEMYRNLYSNHHESLLQRKDDTNVFLLASQKISGILCDHLSLYRLQAAVEGYPGEMHALDNIDSSVIDGNGLRTNSVRLPVYLQDFLEQMHPILDKLQQRRLRYLWALSPSPEGSFLSKSPDSKLTCDSDDLQDEKWLLPLFDVTPFLPFENASSPESPSIYLASVDKRFYRSLIGTDKRRKLNVEQGLTASPVNTHCARHTSNRHTNPLSTSTIGQTVKSNLQSHKKYDFPEFVPADLDANMAGGDVHNGDIKGLRRRLWDVEGNNGDHNKAPGLMSTTNMDSKAEFGSGWQNEEVEKGFLTAFDLLGSPKYFQSPSASMKLKYKNEKSPPPIKLTDSIKALRKLQKEFADRDIGPEACLSHKCPPQKSTSPGNMHPESEALPQENGGIFHLLNRLVEPISLKEPNLPPKSQTGGICNDLLNQFVEPITLKNSKIQPENQSEINECSRGIQNYQQEADFNCSDIPEQDYYCLESSAEFWDEPTDQDFDFESNINVALNGYQNNNNNVNSLASDLLQQANGSTNSEQVNTYQAWSTSDCSEQYATNLRVHKPVQGTTTNDPSIVYACTEAEVQYPTDNDPSIVYPCHPTLAHYPRDSDPSLVNACTQQDAQYPIDNDPSIVNSCTQAVAQYPSESSWCIQKLMTGRQEPEIPKFPPQPIPQIDPQIHTSIPPFLQPPSVATDSHNAGFNQQVHPSFRSLLQPPTSIVSESHNAGFHQHIHPSIRPLLHPPTSVVTDSHNMGFNQQVHTSIPPLLQPTTSVSESHNHVGFNQHIHTSIPPVWQPPTSVVTESHNMGLNQQVPTSIPPLLQPPANVVTDSHNVGFNQQAGGYTPGLNVPPMQAHPCIYFPNGQVLPIHMQYPVPVAPHTQMLDPKTVTQPPQWYPNMTQLNQQHVQRPVLPQCQMVKPQVPFLGTYPQLTHPNLLPHPNNVRQ